MLARPSRFQCLSAEKTELEQLRSTINDVRSGCSRVVMVRGESGSGKSRLVMEAFNEAGKQGLRCFKSEATERVGEQAVAPLTKLLNSLAQSNLALTLAKELEPDHQEIREFFPDFAKAIGLKGPQQSTDTEDRLSSTSETKDHSAANVDSFDFQRLSRTVCNILSRISSPDAPALIWIDDCQWLDNNTRESLLELSRSNTQSLLILLSSRTSRDQSATDQVRFEFDADIELEPLSDEKVSELINTMAVNLAQNCGRNDRPPGFGKSLHGRSDSSRHGGIHMRSNSKADNG